MCENRITPILQSILDEVIAYGSDCDLPQWCRTGIVSGQAAWDVCCSCGDGSGQLWVRMIEWLIDPEFIPPGPMGCDQPTLLSIGVGSLRCVPTLDEQGHPPSAEEEQFAAELIHWDAEALRNAVMCGLEERFWVSWQAVDNAGGCGGGEHIFQIPFYPCNCNGSEDLESPGSP